MTVQSSPVENLPAAVHAPANPHSPTISSVIQGMIDAGRPLIYIQSAEEDRIVGVLSRLAEQGRGGRVDLFIWSVTKGLQLNGKPAKDGPDSPRGMLDLIIAHDKPAIFLLKDFHEFIREAVAGSDWIATRRRLRDLYYECLDSGKFAVIVSPVKIIPDEINREVAFSDLPRPDLKELEELLQAEAAAVSGGAKVELPKETVYVLTRTVQGLSFHEARHALRLAITEHGKVDTSIVRTLEHEKQQLVRKIGLVEFVPNTIGIDQIGGLGVSELAQAAARPVLLPRKPLRGDRPQGPAADGRLRLRQEPLGQGGGEHLRACRCTASTWSASSRRASAARSGISPPHATPWKTLPRPWHGSTKSKTPFRASTRMKPACSIASSASS